MNKQGISVFKVYCYFRYKEFAICCVCFSDGIHVRDGRNRYYNTKSVMMVNVSYITHSFLNFGREANAYGCTPLRGLPLSSSRASPCDRCKMPSGTYMMLLPDNDLKIHTCRMVNMNCDGTNHIAMCTRVIQCRQWLFKNV